MIRRTTKEIGVPGAWGSPPRNSTLAEAGRQAGHQRDAMPSRIYCRGLRRAEEGGDDEGPERLGAPYSSGTSAARDTSSGRLLSS